MNICRVMLMVLPLIINSVYCLTNHNTIKNEFISKILPDLIRFRRQSGYNYNKPQIPFELPKISIGSTTGAPDSKSFSKKNEDYSYPKPSISTQSSLPSTPSKAPERDEDAYKYNAPTDEQLTDSKSSTKGYYYNTPTQSTSGNSVYSTNGPEYLPPKVSVTPTTMSSSSRNVEIINSTPGKPYLPPKIDLPITNGQPFAQSMTSYPSEFASPTPNIISSTASPPKIQTSYLVPLGSIASLPKPPVNSYLSPGTSDISKDQSLIPSQNAPRDNVPINIPPRNNYVPPPPGGRSATSTISTPANSYLPPYN